ncbi:MAG: N-formylglutamate amidohydrolase [Actinomycetota bacterium]|nr:N-formylglutamate amidohydrolase [Actinomycetota bacterium]
MVEAWEKLEGAGPIVACAVHAGHEVRTEVAALLALDDATRRREEDPYTGAWTALAPTRLVVHRSRFEVDLNRSRPQAVYLEPGDAWGLRCWKEPPPEQVVETSRRLHDAFYTELEAVLRGVEAGYGRFVVYDLHSYNHRRAGAGARPGEEPEINLGTGSMDRDRWAPVADRLLADLTAQPVGGRRLDVRENVRFKGGYLVRWIHETFPLTGCGLAIDVKKFFMDEHTGRLDRPRWEEVGRALAATVPGVLTELDRC